MTCHTVHVKDAKGIQFIEMQKVADAMGLCFDKKADENE